MNTHRFLKVILSDETQTTGIRLPKKFSDEHGKYLSERVTLKVPNGDVWQADLHKSGGDEIWIKNGWWEFAERYHLGFSNLLMFEYQGLSTFSVVIFHAGASEINYHEHTGRLITSAKPDAGKCPVSCDQLKTIIVDDDDDTSSSSGENEEHVIKTIDESSNETNRMEDRRRSIEKAKANFKCDEPFFMVYIDKPHFKNRGVFLPAEFRRKMLRNPMDRCECLLILNNDGKFKAWKAVAKGRYLGHADWLMFVKDNGVKVGDICVLELIHKDKNVLGVTIVRSGC